MGREHRGRALRPHEAAAAAGAGAVILAIALACAPPPNAGQTGVVVNGRTSGGTTAACDGSNPSQVGCVNVRVDEFRQQTIVEAWMRVLGVTVGGMRVAVIGIATGAGGDTDATWSLHVEGAGWQYLECHSLDFLLDGRPVSVPNPRHRGDVHTGGVTEHISFDASHEMMVAIARAGSFRGRLCNDTFALTADQLATVRAFVSEFDRAHATERPTPRQATASDSGASVPDDAAVPDAAGDAGAWWAR